MGKNAEEYPIRDGMHFGSYSFDDLSHEEIKNQLSKLNPEAVGAAATAYKEAAEALAEMTEELRNDFAKRIVDHWQGEVAQEALDQLGQVYNTSAKLSDDSHNNATLYNWYKTHILDWYKTSGETMTDGVFYTDGDDERARELMKNFNTRMQEAFNGHPLKITKDLPSGYGGGHDQPPGPGPGPGGGPGGFPGGGGGAPGRFGGGAGGAGFPTSDGAGSFSPSGGSTSPFAPGGGSPFSPPGGSGPHLTPGTGGAGGIGSGIGSGGSPFDGAPSTDLSSFPGGGGGGGLPGGGGGLPGGGLPGGGLPGGGGGFGADPGGFGGAAGAGTGGGFGAGGAGAAGRAAAGGMRGGMPMAGMPMAPGAGQGGKNEERERDTWLTEDEDVWGADDDTAPPVIG